MKSWFKKLFVPVAENDYAPHSLREKAIIGMAVMVCLTFFASNTHALLWSTSKWMVSTVLPAVIVDLTNEERVDYDLQKLRRSSVLDLAAKMKAEHMAKNEYFSHFSPDGVSPWYWFGEAQYNFVHAGENLAIHFNDSGEVVDAWMDSPTHKDNIVNSDYTEIGVGTAKGKYDGFDTVYVVQLFGTPAAEPEVASATASEPEVVEEVAVVEVVPETNTPPVLLDEPIEVISDTSEAVTVTEEVTYTEPEPVPMIVYNEVETNEANLLAVAEDDSGNQNTEEVEVVAMESTESGIALYSDHLSTSTGGVPASMNPEDASYNNSGTTPLVYKLASQPNVVLSYIYTALALFVGSVLVLSVLVDARRQQPVQVAYSLSLLLLMTVLWSLHSYLTAGAVIA